MYNIGLESLADANAPYKTVRITRKSNPWYTSQTSELKRKKRQLERLYMKTKSSSDHKVYSDFCKQYYSHIKRIRISFNKNAIAECGHDQKKISSLSNRLLGSRVKPYPDADSDQQLANDFIDFFVQKSHNVYQELLQYQNNTNGDCSNDQVVPYLNSFEPTKENEVKDIMLKMANKQCDLDPVPTWIVKQFCNNLAPVITIIVDRSLELGVVPQPLKKAMVRPGLKKPSLDSKVHNNYRPVSNLPVLSKIIEKVVFIRIEEHCRRHNLLDPNQSAYRKLHSTETALLRVHNDILQQLDKGCIVALVLIDVSAAFDTVNHQSLLNRLQKQFGLGGVALKWMESYLRGREQFVNINGTYSKVVLSDHGFPQGATLAGLLYNLFSKPIGDVVAKHPKVDHNAFADDNGCYISFRIDEQAEAVDILARCVNKVGDWMNENFLKINDDKTETILFLPTKRTPIVQSGIQIRTETVHPLSSVEYLGVTFDKFMQMEKQINIVSRTCYYHIRRISKIRKYLDVDSAKTLVQNLVISRLDYCNSLLVNLPKRLIQKLQKVQNHCARLIYRKKRRTRTNPLLKDLHWLPLQYRIKFKVLLLTFKCLNGLAPRYLVSMLTVYRPPRTLRSNTVLMGTLITPYFKKRKHGERSFAVAAPKLWNGIPRDIRTASSVAEFKVKLKTHFFNEHFNHQNNHIKIELST